MTHEPSDSPLDSHGPDYVVPVALRRKLQKCYEHGTSLMSDDDYDYDYANTMFTECVVKDPSNLVYVEAFLENLQRKYKNNKRGARTLSFGGKGPIKKAIQKQDWKEVLQQGPVLLKSNPWDVTVLRGMAHACEAFQFNEVELRYLKNALDANPKDADVNRHCAQSLARMGQFDQAIACWHRVEEAKRYDPEPPKMISALTIEKSRARAGFGSDDSPNSRATTNSAATAGAGPTAGGGPRSAGTAVRSPSPASPDAAGHAASTGADSDAPPDSPGDTNKESAEDPTEPATPPRRREIELTPRQKLERAIVDYPEGPENYLKLAELHLEEHRPAEAEKVLTKALAVSGGDIKIRERLEDATAQRMRHQLAIAEQRAEAKKTDEAYELVQQVRKNLARYELDVLQSRTERYPGVEPLKYQLGRRLKRLGNYQEAVAQLQQVRQDPDCNGPARLELGECLQHLKQYPKALLAYEHAIEATESSAQADYHKLALYRAGVLATALRQLGSAERHLSALRQLDPDFKDVSDRLDKLRQIRDKE